MNNAQWLFAWIAVCKAMKRLDEATSHNNNSQIATCACEVLWWLVACEEVLQSEYDSATHWQTMSSEPPGNYYAYRELWRPDGHFTAALRWVRNVPSHMGEFRNLVNADAGGMLRWQQASALTSRGHPDSRSHYVQLCEGNDIHQSLAGALHYLRDAAQRIGLPFDGSVL